MQYSALLRFWRRLSYLLPLRIIIVLIFFLFLIVFPFLGFMGALQYSVYFQSSDAHYAKFLVRNRAVERVNRANAYFHEMTNKKLLPYRYPSSSSNFAFNVSRASSDAQPLARNLSIVIMCHNRNTHDVDAYEPHYLTQTIHALLTAIDNDVANYGLRWGSINMRLCNVDPHPHECRECEEMHSNIVVGKNGPQWNFVDHVAGKREIEKMLTDSKHSSCLTQKQFAFCMSKASELNPFSHVVLLEDDMIARRDGIQALWQIFDSIERRFGADKPSAQLGFVQLYSPMHALSYSAQDASTYLELFVIGGGLSFILLLLYFRVHLRTIHLVYNVVFLGSMFGVCVAFAILVGRSHWLQAYHAVTRHYYLGKPATEDVSSVFMTNQGANALANYLSQRSCSWKETAFSKANVINQFMRSNDKQILTLYPSAFQHVGLYSYFHHGTHQTHEMDA